MQKLSRLHFCDEIETIMGVYDELYVEYEKLFHMCELLKKAEWDYAADRYQWKCQLQKKERVIQQLNAKVYDLEDESERRGTFVSDRIYIEGLQRKMIMMEREIKNVRAKLNEKQSAIVTVQEKYRDLMNKYNESLMRNKDNLNKIQRLEFQSQKFQELLKTMSPKTPIPKVFTPKVDNSRKSDIWKKVDAPMIPQTLETKERRLPSARGTQFPNIGCKTSNPQDIIDQMRRTSRPLSKRVHPVSMSPMAPSLPLHTRNSSNVEESSELDEQTNETKSPQRRPISRWRLNIKKQKPQDEVSELNHS